MPVASATSGSRSGFEAGTSASSARARLREPERGRLTLALGAIWLLLAALTGVSFLSDGIDSVKGLLQRGDQIIFGVWLALLGFWARDW